MRNWEIYKQQNPVGDCLHEYTSKCNRNLILKSRIITSCLRDNCFESDLFFFSCLSGEDINVVPVVMGGANYARLVIPGSYINVMDFKTVKQLADYLYYLDKNNTAYNEYFKWRVKYKVFRNNLDLTLCQICKWYVSKSPLEPKVYGDLATHWVGKGRCHEKNHLITNMCKK